MVFSSVKEGETNTAFKADLKEGPAVCFISNKTKKKQRTIILSFMYHDISIFLVFFVILKSQLKALACGEGEIRTHETRKGLPVFKTGALNRSATSPYPLSAIII